MFTKHLENVRTKSPLIHNITNYVTVNDCANILVTITIFLKIWPMKNN